ncbi:MAG: V-type ATPase subunit, partial [Bacilli bacterium]|nr:V-type ATPase subunit [Bacilli bacterium]
MKYEYTCAVARVRARETSLLRKNDLEQLLSYDSLEDRLNFLRDKGWGKDDDKTLGDILKTESEKLWGFIKEITKDELAFELFMVPYDYENLKTAIKTVVMDRNSDDVFLNNGTIDAKVIYRSIKERDYGLLP